MNSLFKTGFWRGVACARAADEAKPRADCLSTLERAATRDCMVVVVSNEGDVEETEVVGALD